MDYEEDAIFLPFHLSPTELENIRLPCYNVPSQMSCCSGLHSRSRNVAALFLKLPKMNVAKSDGFAAV